MESEGRNVSLTRAIALSAIFFFCLIAVGGCNRGRLPRELGKPAPPFTIHDGSQTASLQQYRGHVLLLNFWASWCAPCVTEIPSLEALHRRLPQLEILGVSIDTDKQAYQNFLAKYRIDFPTIRDPSSAVMHRYGTVQIPETYIIDRSGHIARKYVSNQHWDSPVMVEMLQSILNEKN